MTIKDIMMVAMKCKYYYRNAMIIDDYNDDYNETQWLLKT